jgi:hypothetical protein
MIRPWPAAAALGRSCVCSAPPMMLCTIPPETASRGPLPPRCSSLRRMGAGGSWLRWTLDRETAGALKSGNGIGCGLMVRRCRWSGCRPHRGAGPLPRLRTAGRRRGGARCVSRVRLGGSPASIKSDADTARGHGHRGRDDDPLHGTPGPVVAVTAAESSCGRAYVPRYP